MNTVASLTGELARAREAAAGRMRGVDPSDFHAMRRAYEAFAENDPLPEGAGQSDIELGGVKCLGVLPRDAKDDRVILWLHGGGFSVGSPISHRGLASQVAARANCAVLLPDYRLAPEHVYPAALDDCLSVYRTVLSEGILPERLVIAGDSAGGGLAVAIALRLKAERVAMPSGLLLLSPWINLACTGWSYEAKAQRDPFLTRAGLEASAKRYLGRRGPGETGVDLINADLRGLPPTYIQAGEAEILLSDSTALAERLGAAGSPVTLEIWPDMFHVFQARYPMLTQSRQAIDRLGQWVGAHIGL